MMAPFFKAFVKRSLLVVALTLGAAFHATWGSLVLALFLFPPDIGHAAIFTVNSFEDMKDADLADNVCRTAAGTCTLRAAIEQSNATAGSDVIRLRAGRYVLTLGELVIEKDILTIRGGGAGTLTPDGMVVGGTIIDANRNSRVITIGQDWPEGATVHLIDVTIQHGMAFNGGGIFITEGSSLFLTRSIVNQNSAEDSGGGIVNLGTLNIVDSTINRNDAGLQGGGAIINFGGSGTIRGSTIDNNRANGGGATGGGGIENRSFENSGGVLVITNSTISGNAVTGGITSRGGGINNAQGATLVLRNVTIANNRATGGSAGEERRGGGIFNEDGSTVTLMNTIIDGNIGQTGGPDCFGTLTSRGFNLISNTTNCNISGTNNILNMSADLDMLGPNGGPTWTHALMTSTPAINAGNNCPMIDQRRFRRVDRCDIGAYEFGGVPPP